MAKISWDAVGERFYETGIDRGVLYVDGKTAVPWNGLTSVKYSSEGGDLKSYYIEGKKYLTLNSSEDFVGTIKALFSPPEFDECDGSLEIFRGVYATQQMRKKFSFTYRTMVGNDIDGQSHGYRIHLILNALAKPSSREYQTINDSPEPSILSWDIASDPVEVFQNVYSSHLIFDSRITFSNILSEIEDILYGTDTSSPRMLTPSELINKYESYDSIFVTDNGDGTWTAQGNDDIIRITDGSLFSIDSREVVMINSTTYSMEVDGTV